MASTQPESSGPSSHMNSPILPPKGAPLLSNGTLSDLNLRSSPGPSHGASLQGDSARSKRSRRDSRKKREAKGLDSDGPPPKKKTTVAHHAALSSSSLSVLRPLVLAEPRSSDRLPPQPRQLNFACRKTISESEQYRNFYEVVDKLTNKNGFRYSYAIADPHFPHIKYRQTDLRPYHARFSFEDSPPAISFSDDALAVTACAAWHTARTNVCAREGAYYYEARVISGVPNYAGGAKKSSSGSFPHGHVRLGFARREADLDANVGIDCYGYGIRDVNGEVVNRMRCERFFPEGESIRQGDVIGMLITLPPLHIHKRVVEGTYDPAYDSGTVLPFALNTIRDRTPFHYKGDFCWQQSNVFPSKQLRDYAFNMKEPLAYAHPSPLNAEDASLRTLPGSSITIFKNGVNMGTPFKELFAFLPPASRLANGTNNVGIGERENADDGMIGYYPAVSCYGGGAVECRFGPPWWFPPPSYLPNGEPVRAIGERYNEQIIEDIVADIVDELEMISIWGSEDGGVVENTEPNTSAASATATSGALENNDIGALYEDAVPHDLSVSRSARSKTTVPGDRAIVPESGSQTSPNDTPDAAEVETPNETASGPEGQANRAALGSASEDVEMTGL